MEFTISVYFSRVNMIFNRFIGLFDPDEQCYAKLLSRSRDKSLEQLLIYSRACSVCWKVLGRLKKEFKTNCNVRLNFGTCGETDNFSSSPLLGAYSFVTKYKSRNTLIISFRYGAYFVRHDYFVPGIKHSPWNAYLNRCAYPSWKISTGMTIQDSIYIWYKRICVTFFTQRLSEEECTDPWQKCQSICKWENIFFFS